MSFYQQLLQHTETARAHLLARPLIEQTLAGQVTLPRYLAFLGEAYHHVSHTVPLLMACGARLDADQQWLQPALIEYINEERGHEQWVLADIAAAGGDPVDVLEAGPCLATETMVAYAYHGIERHNPVSLLGMVHVLEGTSSALATRAADQIQARLSLPDNALRYLRSHGSLDQEHVSFYEQLVNRIQSQQDRRAIIHAANAFYHLYGAIFDHVANAVD
ncbi:TenA family transcriptional regulator [Motiliproteus sp. SC1-56]|uniref:TenA family transcriptional regulator n=1 Tax=Motiliproteus sp. SC1-56 TaxID=2799565 RepID=UPI001A8DF4D1|nr:iron-containing redox enzyme family protein [Motiliproteus sp. SC1-56]